MDSHAVSWAVCSKRARLRPQMIAVAPRPASFRAIAAPIPLPPPVTKAVRPARLSFTEFSLGWIFTQSPNKLLSNELGVDGVDRWNLVDFHRNLAIHDSNGLAGESQGK